MDKKPKIFLGNNISAKLRSATFWTGFIPALATFVVSVCSLLGVDIAEDVVNQYTAIGGVIVSLLTSFGVLVSHDTKGVQDSPIVKSFNKPRDYDDPEQYIQFSEEASDEEYNSLPTSEQLSQVTDNGGE